MAAALLALRLALSFSSCFCFCTSFSSFLFSLIFCQLLGSSFADACLTARADSFEETRTHKCRHTHKQIHTSTANFCLLSGEINFYMVSSQTKCSSMQEQGTCFIAGCVSHCENHIELFFHGLFHITLLT